MGLVAPGRGGDEVARRGDQRRGCCRVARRPSGTSRSEEPCCPGLIAGGQGGGSLEGSRGSRVAPASFGMGADGVEVLREGLVPSGSGGGPVPGRAVVVADLL